jgi:hypothetical protein
MPHYNYSVSTHVTIFCGNGYYVSKPRGVKFNNRNGGTYKPTNTVVKSHRTNIKTVKPNTNRTNVKINTNKNTGKSNIRVNTNKNTNKSNIRVNTNKNTNKNNINRSNNRVNIKTNINRSNKSRSNKNNIKRPR